jgi:hypothetical protein
MHQEQHHRKSDREGGNRAKNQAASRFAGMQRGRRKEWGASRLSRAAGVFANCLCRPYVVFHVAHTPEFYTAPHTLFSPVFFLRKFRLGLKKSKDCADRGNEAYPALL